MGAMMIEKCRNDFPLIHESQLVYLDNAATTHKPQVVIDALVDFYTKHNAPVHRGIYPLAEEATQQYEAVRCQVAQFINARSPREIVFTSGATNGCNLVAGAWGQTSRGLDSASLHETFFRDLEDTQQLAARVLHKNVSAGDEIVVSVLEHHSNLLPWQRLARQVGAKLVWLPITADARIDLAALETVITPKAKLVALTLDSNVVGPTDRAALQAIVRRARMVGARVFLDAAQAVAHQPIDVQALDCDFLVFSSHKVYGPTGVGILYVRQSEHAHLDPYEVGGGMVYEVQRQGSVWRSMPQFLEAGTPPIAQVIGLGAALTYLGQVTSWDLLATHETSLVNQFLTGLEGIQGLKVLGSPEKAPKSHVVSFFSKKYHSHDIAAFCATQGICVRAGHHCCQLLHNHLGVESSVRVSFGIYNTPEDVAVLNACLAKFLR